MKIGDENDLGGFHTFRACQGQEFTLENLVNYIIKRCMDFETEQLKLEGVHITLDKIEYAFLDCGNDGSSELAIRIETPSSMKGNTETIIIKEKDGKLETIYSDWGCEKSRIFINEYGYIYGDRWSGACCVKFDKAFLDAGGKYHYIYSNYVDSCAMPYVSFEFLFDKDGDSYVTVYAMVDQADKPDDNAEDEFELGYKGYCFSDWSIIHNDSLYEKSGKIYEHFEQRGLLSAEDLVTINELDKMIAEKEKKEGLTEEIKSGKTIEWEELNYSF